VLGRDHAATVSLDANVHGALGPLGVFVARFIPGLRFLAGPLAGTAGLRFTPFITANVLGAIVYVPVIVTAGFAVGYGAGTHVERVLRTLGPVEYVVLTVAVVAAVPAHDGPAGA
jgi:membrane protein DedA with SNARE-associated domain